MTKKFAEHWSDTDSSEEADGWPDVNLPALDEDINEYYHLIHSRNAKTTLKMRGGRGSIQLDLMTTLQHQAETRSQVRYGA